MRGLFVRRHRGGAARRAVLVIPAVVAGGFFLDSVTRSAGAAVSTHTAGGLASSSVNAIPAPDPATPDAATPESATPDDAAHTATTTTATATTIAATTTTTTTTTTTVVVSATVETEPSVVTTTLPGPTPAVEPAPSVAAAVEATDAGAAADAVGVAAVTDAAVATGLPPPTNQSTCRSDLPGAVMTITMADISYLCAVYPGGQSVIDSGVAAVITAEESPFALAAGPGDVGTLWITGHRVSHGGPFAAVPDLADGAIVTVSDGMVTASYVIVGRAYVEVRDGLAVDATGQTTEAATLDAVLRADRNADLAPRLLLQTCDAEDFRWMIYADLVIA